MKDVAIYMPVGKSLREFQISSREAIERSGLDRNSFYFIVVTDCGTSDEVRAYIADKKKSDGWIQFDIPRQETEDKPYLYRIYCWWNEGYKAFEKLGVSKVCPIGSDHRFYKDWLKNLVKYCDANTLPSCKLIERGVLSSIHECHDFGTVEDFKQEEFDAHCAKIWREGVLTDREWGRRTDAMPMAIHKEVWKKYGPLEKRIVGGVTGDTRFFDFCRLGGVRTVQVLSSISYHSQSSKMRSR